MTRKPEVFDRPVLVHPERSFVDRELNAAIAKWWVGSSSEDQTTFLSDTANKTLGASVDGTCLALSRLKNRVSVSHSAADVRALHIVKYLSAETLTAVGVKERSYFLPVLENEFWPAVDTFTLEHYERLALETEGSRFIVTQQPSIEDNGRLYEQQKLGIIGGVAVSRTVESVSHGPIAIHYHSDLI